LVWIYQVAWNEAKRLLSDFSRLPRSSEIDVRDLKVKDEIEHNLVPKDNFYRSELVFAATGL